MKAGNSCLSLQMTQRYELVKYDNAYFNILKDDKMSRHKHILLHSE